MLQEWYTPEPDYNLPDQGSPSFKDFDYNAVIFPQPTDQLKTYHDELNLRFGGIRKPRLGNSGLLTMAKSKGWLVDPKAGTGSAYNARDLNYSIPEVREWYASQMSHFLSDGVDFWWNDEGESSYFNFYYWNDAQRTMLAKFDKKRDSGPLTVPIHQACSAKAHYMDWRCSSHLGCISFYPWIRT